MDYQLISLIATGTAIVGVVAGYLDLGRRKSQEQQEAEKVLRQAQDKAEHVLRQAQDKALEILEKARLDTEARSEKLEVRLDRAEEKEITDFRKALGQTTTALVQAQIEGYKVKKMQEVDARAQEMVQQVTRAVLGKALDTAKHIALIKGALEEAKSAHVL